jgi:hypothetical protein
MHCSVYFTPLPNLIKIWSLVSEIKHVDRQNLPCVPAPYEITCSVSPSLLLTCLHLTFQKVYVSVLRIKLNLLVWFYYCFHLPNSWYRYTIRFYICYTFWPDLAILRYIGSHNYLFLFLPLLLHMTSHKAMQIMHSQCVNTGQCRESSRKRNGGLWDPMYLKLATSGWNI